MPFYQVEAPTFVCGVIVDSKKVLMTAPILGWAKGMAADQFISYCKSKGYIMREITRGPNAEG